MNILIVGVSTAAGSRLSSNTGVCPTGSQSRLFRSRSTSSQTFAALTDLHKASRDRADDRTAIKTKSADKRGLSMVKVLNGKFTGR